MVKESTSHILIVEDDAKVRLLLRRCFEGEGYRVAEAASGAEAVKLLGAGSFDLVTLDLNLPDGDGLTVGREIRARSEVPIIMVTGKGDTIAGARCRRLHCQAVPRARGAGAGTRRAAAHGQQTGRA